jgi:hypothetical protein
MPPGYVTRLRVKWAEDVGVYVWHCHILGELAR